MVYIYQVGYYSVIKKNEIMLFATTGMDMEIFILHLVWKPNRGKQVSYITSMWNQKTKKKGTDKLIDKTETDSET